VHILDTEGVIEIEFVNNIALTGDHTMVPSESEFPFQPSSKIWCTGHAGFAFMFVENLLIENLSFTDCGTPQSPHSKWSSVLLFSYVTNLTICHVVVQNTTGFGILGYALKYSRIYESALVYNHGDENHLGGNVYIIFDDCCSPGNNVSASLNIRSTYILYGDTPHSADGFPTGLSVSLARNLCMNTYLVLDNVTVSQNKNGNLALSLSYSATSGVSVTIENSQIEGGKALAGGGNIVMNDACSELQLHDCPAPQTNNQTSTLRIFNTIVTRNVGQDLLILVDSKCAKYNIEIDQVIFSENNSSSTFCSQAYAEGPGLVTGGSGALLILGTSFF